MSRVGPRPKKLEACPGTYPAATVPRDPVEGVLHCFVGFLYAVHRGRFVEARNYHSGITWWSAQPDRLPLALRGQS